MNKELFVSLGQIIFCLIGCVSLHIIQRKDKPFNRLETIQIYRSSEQSHDSYPSQKEKRDE